jgi:malate dehydrogenase (decarboxylating)
LLRHHAGNNFYVFPGIGLGALLSGASVVSDGMLQAAAEALPRMLTPEVLAQGVIYPRVRDIRAVSATVAVAVMRAAHAEGHTRNKEARRLMLLGRSDDELRDWAMTKMFKPSYVPLVPRPLN